MPVGCKHMQTELNSKLNSTEVYNLLLCLSETPMGCRLRWQTTIGPSHSVNFKTENKPLTYLPMVKISRFKFSAGEASSISLKWLNKLECW